MWNPFKRNKPIEESQSLKKHKKRTFQAAKTDRFTLNWSSGDWQPNALIRGDLKALRSRSREAVRNNEYAKKAMDLYDINIVGARGVILQNLSKNRSGKIDRPATEAIEREWRNWSRAEHCDIARRFSWKDIQSTVVKNWFMDGEALIRIYRGTTLTGSKYGFALQVLDPALLDVDLNQDTPNKFGNKIRQGIEVDPLGRPVAYYISQVAEGQDSYVIGGKSYKRIAASEIVHIIHPDYAGQMRGVPVQHAGLLSLHHIHEYKKSAQIAARAGATAMMFLKTDEPQSVDPDELYDEEDTEGAGYLEFEPLTIQELPAGASMEQFSTAYPNGDFPEFMRTSLEAYASSVGLIYSLLTSDLRGVNFSSLKNGRDQMYNWFESLQVWLAEQLHDRIYEKWLKSQLNNATIKIGDTPLDAMRYDKYREVSWSGPKPKPLDPAKEANANTTELSNGTTSVHEICRARGVDFEQLVTERATEQERFKELGITLEYKLSNEVPTDDTE